MSVQVTKEDNFIKINIGEGEDVHWTEYSYNLKKFDESLYSKIYWGVVDYDKRDKSGMICSKNIYVFCSDNSCYAISSNKGMTCINKRTIYDEKNPNVEDFGIPEDEMSDFDKTCHIDDKTILIYPREKNYTIQNVKHGLYSHTTFYGRFFDSKYYFHGTADRQMLLEMAQELVEEIKSIENIEEVLDLSIFDTIPKPGVKRLTNEKKRPITEYNFVRLNS